jgi:hypothetical protein
VTVLLKIPCFAPLTLQFSENEMLADHTQPDAKIPFNLEFIQLLIGSDKRQLHNVLRDVDIGQTVSRVPEQYSLILPYNGFVGIEIAAPNVINRFLLHSASLLRNKTFSRVGSNLPFVTKFVN